MKENNKLESIATLSEEEMVNTKGGASLSALSLAIVDYFPIGIPPFERYLVNQNILKQEAIINATALGM